MRMNCQDPSSTSRNQDRILKILPSILLDSILVNQNFAIVSVSQNVLDMLEFTLEELKGKPFAYLTNDSFSIALKESLTNSSFDSKKTRLTGKTKQVFEVSFSGFCVDWLTGDSGYLLLRVSQHDKSDLLEKKSSELDKFIYSTAHDLRGPLATMKGLINLLKVRKDNIEVDRFVHMLDAHANKLDERLFQLIYVADSGSSCPEGENLDFGAIETRLRQTIEKNAFVDFLDFHFQSPGTDVPVKPGLLMLFLNNILRYLLDLPMTSMDTQLFFRILMDGNFLDVTIASRGFEAPATLRAVIEDKESLYMEMAHNPQIMHLHAAEKIAWQLQSAVTVQFLSSDKQRISARIPITLPLARKSRPLARS
jgi:hypothetical protein